jgi:hypothetical protein
MSSRGFFFDIAAASGIMIFQGTLDGIFSRLDMEWSTKLVRYVEEAEQKIRTEEKELSSDSAGPELE